MRGLLSIALLVACVAAPVGARKQDAPGPNRVVVLPVDALKARYLDVGDHVDVLWVRQTSTGWVAETVAMDVAVTAVELGGAKAKLSVSAPWRSADALALAVKTGGSFMAAGRAPGDHDTFVIEPARIERLMR